MHIIAFSKREEMPSNWSTLLHSELGSMQNCADRGIVYCLKIEDAGRIQHMGYRPSSNSQFYLYNGAQLRKEGTDNHQGWIAQERNEPKAIIATGASSCGIYYRHVRKVMPVGGSRSLLAFVQEYGRGGLNVKNC